MKRENRGRICSKYMMQQYDELLACKKLGYYNSCEMITIFIIEKNTKYVYNFYTIFIMEERLTVREECDCLTSKLVSISERYSMGMQRKVQKVEKIRSIMQSLCESCESQSVDIGDGCLQIGKLEMVPKTFVPQNSTVEITMNKVLKNNFQNGSYVLEFFDAEERVKNTFSKKELRKITDAIFERIPVDLFTLSDRIGNFVFQFPSINTRITYEIGKDESALHYKLDVDERLGEENHFILQAELMDDGNIIGFGIAECKKSESGITFQVGNSSSSCRSTLIDMESQLILARQDTSFFMQANIRMHFGMQYGEQRLIFNTEGEITNSIDVVSGEDMRVGQTIIRSRENRIGKRQYGQRVEKVYNSKEFRSYDKTQEREKALKDIITLMNMGDGGKVYLWDPYLTLEDLLETWYYTTTYGMQLKAITSSEIAEKNGISVKEWIKQQRDFINNRSNHYGIKMEIRCQWKEYGYHFHDRFLMVIKGDEGPKVWSLGTSINSLGNKHHIIQRVKNPQMIVDAFEELWGGLDSEECLVWKKG